MNPTTLMVGSSIILRWPTDRDRVVNRGQHRLKTDVLPTYLTVVLDQLEAPRDVDLVVFYAGGNDLRATTAPDPRAVAEVLTAAVETVYCQCPYARVLLLAVMKGPRLVGLERGVLVDAVNAELRAFAATRPWIQYVDTNADLRPHHYLDDGVHLREEGYAVLNALCFG